MHKKEAKYVVNLTNKIIALDGRHVDKFGLLYLGNKAISQWKNIYSILIRKGKIKLARTYDEAMSILKMEIPNIVRAEVLKRGAASVKDNTVKEFPHNESIKRYTTDEVGYEGTLNMTAEINLPQPFETLMEETLTGSDTQVESETIEETLPGSDEQVEVEDLVNEPQAEPVVEETEVIEEESVQAEESVNEETTSFGLEGDAEEETSVEDMSSELPKSVSELKKIAKERGVAGYGKMTKEELLEALK